MKELNSPVKFLAFMLINAVFYPRTPIRYYYCQSCKLRFNTKEKECPKCKDKVIDSPHNVRESPIPWWGSVLCIIIGIITWIISACINMSELGEAGRVLVYIPLGSLFGMSIQR